MSQKGRKPATSAQTEAGEKNLQNWVAEHPSRGNFRHGAHSGVVRHRYGDKRYREGKQLAEIMEALLVDCGGSDKVTAAQRLILDNIKAKIIVIFQISKYVDRQPSIIDAQGNLLPCLGRGFTTYNEALRRDLEALATMTNKKPSKTPSIEEIIAKGEKGW